MNNRVLGTLALLGAPFLFLGSHLAQGYPSLGGAWFYGVWALVFLTAWLCSIRGLRRLEATGSSRLGKAMLWAITGTLLLANLFNLYALLAPHNTSTLFFMLDSFWPISNLGMLAVGVMVWMHKGLPGWRRYVPLIVGLWLPLSMGLMHLLGQESPWVNLIDYYSAIAWSVLAWVVLTSPERPAPSDPASLRASH